MSRMAGVFQRPRSGRAFVAAPFQGGRRRRPVEGQGFQPCRKAARAKCGVCIRRGGRIPIRSVTCGKFSPCDTEIRNQRSQNLLE